LTISESGRFVAAANQEGYLRAWEFESGREVLGLRTSRSFVCISPDDRWLAFAGPGYVPTIYDLRTGRLVATLPAHQWSISALAFTPDGRTLLSASADNTVRLWDVRTWQQVRVLQGDMGGLNSVTVSPEGRTIATWSYDHTLRLWHATTCRELLSMKTSESELLFSPDGRWLAASWGDAPGPGAGAQLWHAPSFTELEQVRAR
jgi:WD40 repeat protein